MGNGQSAVGQASHLVPAPETVIAAARGWLGTPYVHQASAKGAGTDCLGLIRGVYRELYGREPEIPPPYGPDWNERHWYKGAREEPLLSAARRHLVERDDGAMAPGDVLIFRVVTDGPAKHCGVLTEEARFIHAYAGRCVLETWLSRWWRVRIAGVFGWPAVSGNGQSAIGNRHDADPIAFCPLPFADCRP